MSCFSLLHSFLPASKKPSVFYLSSLIHPHFQFIHHFFHSRNLSLFQTATHNLNDCYHIHLTSLSFIQPARVKPVLSILIIFTHCPHFQSLYLSLLTSITHFLYIFKSNTLHPSRYLYSIFHSPSNLVILHLHSIFYTFPFPQPFLTLHFSTTSSSPTLPFSAPFLSASQPSLFTSNLPRSIS